MEKKMKKKKEEEEDDDEKKKNNQIQQNRIKLGFKEKEVKTEEGQLGRR